VRHRPYFPFTTKPRRPRKAARHPDHEEEPDAQQPHTPDPSHRHVEADITTPEPGPARDQRRPRRDKNKRRPEPIEATVEITTVTGPQAAHLQQEQTRAIKEVLAWIASQKTVES
jgi:hypothetical protein